MFGKSIGSLFWFESPIQTEATSRLLYVTEQGESFVLLLGDRGTGKSSVLRSVRSECRRFGHSCLLISAAALDENALLWHLCGGLSITPHRGSSRSRLMAVIRDEIAGRAMCSHQTVIILDDLDLAAEDLSSVLQFLAAANEQTNGGVSVVAGASGALSSELKQLSALRVELRPFTEQESQEFSLQLLTSLQADTSRIEPDAMAAIVQFGKGLPARLTRLCEVLSLALISDPTLRINAETFHALTGETLLSRAG
ncbi:MAG: ATP-binding protein [Fuerstiella sp.]